MLTPLIRDMVYSVYQSQQPANHVNGAIAGRNRASALIGVCYLTKRIYNTFARLKYPAQLHIQRPLFFSLKNGVMLSHWHKINYEDSMTGPCGMRKSGYHANLTQGKESVQEIVPCTASSSATGRHDADRGLGSQRILQSSLIIYWPSPSFSNNSPFSFCVLWFRQVPFLQQHATMPKLVVATLLTLGLGAFSSSNTSDIDPINNFCKRLNHQCELLRCVSQQSTSMGTDNRSGR